MFWYIFFALCLFALALSEDGKARWPGIVAAIILAVVAGTRYETGFDWVEYEMQFALAVPFGAPDMSANAGLFQVEPGLTFLNMIVVTLGGGFQTSLLIISAVNILLMYRFARQYTMHAALVFLWYYGFCFLAGQMAAMRQCLSFGFTLMAFTAYSRNDFVRFAAWAVISVLFHSFSALFIPIILLSRFRIPMAYFITIGIVSLILRYLALDPIDFVVQRVLPVVQIGFVADKIVVYSESLATRISPFTVALISWHLYIWYVCNRYLRDNPQDGVVKFATWLCALNIVGHTVLIGFPVIWGRTMLLSFFVEPIALTRIFPHLLSNSWRRVQVSTVAFAGATASLIYTLSNSQSIAFKPYQSTLVAAVRGHYGDGRVRYQITRLEIDTIVSEQRRTTIK